MMDYTENFFESIEQRNAEFNSLYYGADYLRGLQVNNLLRVVKKLDFSFLMDAVRLKIANKKMSRYQKKRKTGGTVHKISTYQSYQRLKDKKIVIYTCIVGGYDGLKEPLLLFDNVEYICFTEDAASIRMAEHTKWTICQIPAAIAKKYDRTFSNRYIKMHPKELFPDADYAVYVDGNIGIQSFLGAYLIQTKAKTGVAIFSHSQRQCVYVEAKVCISRRKGRREAIEQQMQDYEKAGFPKNYGLYECTIIATDLSNTLSAELMEKWWQEFIRSKSCRDQLSLPYVMWKSGLKYTDIGLIGEKIFDDCRVTVYSH
ncbi:MAG: DUF616 domain-containing protein [Lachnospiraceae bacterium]|nr:DUF616 domain-containing protein [Lachnospiraceae bacterium]